MLIWNKCGRCPPGCEGIFEAARVADPNAVVWKGDQTLPTDQQGVVVLGALLGHPHFITRILQAKTEEHSVLFRRILVVQDLQCAWLLLLFCAATRANCFLRVCNLIGQSQSVLLTMRTCGTVPRSCWTSKELRGVVESPSSTLGVGVAERRSVPDCRVLGQLGRFTPTNSGKASPHCRPGRGRPVSRQISRRAAATCRERLVDVGFDAPEWGDVARGQRPGRSPENRDPTEPRFGWQCLASADVERTFLQGVIWPELSPADGALLRSQCGPFAGIPFTCSPVVVESRLEPQIFRVLFLRRLWCPLLLSAHFCRCGRPLDVRGHHRSACGRAGVLGRRGECSSSPLPRGRGEGLSQRPRG